MAMLASRPCLTHFCYATRLQTCQLDVPHTEHTWIHWVAYDILGLISPFFSSGYRIYSCDRRILTSVAFGTSRHAACFNEREMSLRTDCSDYRRTRENIVSCFALILFNAFLSISQRLIQDTTFCFAYNFVAADK